MPDREHDTNSVNLEPGVDFNISQPSTSTEGENLVEENQINVLPTGKSRLRNTTERRERCRTTSNRTCKDRTSKNPDQIRQDRINKGRLESSKKKDDIAAQRRLLENDEGSSLRRSTRARKAPPKFEYPVIGEPQVNHIYISYPVYVPQIYPPTSDFATESVYTGNPYLPYDYYSPDQFTPQYVC